MNTRTRMILGIVGSLVIALLFFFFFIKPRQAELAKTNKAVEAARQKTVELQAELQRLQALQANAPKLRAELAEIREFVPNEHEIPNFIFLVQAAANASGVEFLDIVPDIPEPPPEGAAVAQIEINVGADGSYFAIQDFIRRLYGLDRAVRIDELQLTANTEAGVTVLRYDSRVRIFFEPPVQPVPTPAPGATEEPVEEGGV